MPENLYAPLAVLTVCVIVSLTGCQPSNAPPPKAFSAPAKAAS